MDKCIKPLIKWLNQRGFETKACCCGHGKYPMTVVVRRSSDYTYHELFTGIMIPRQRRFYVKDKKGYYYIPEVIKK
jgi:hypothetical protein